jgi:uncharacterized SAM-binding protein YcdF (DUF218 family)
MDIILELGGNVNRMNKAIELAQYHPDALLVVSSESSPDPVVSMVDNAGISRDRLLLDYNAWDTVTNFTTTYKLIKSFNPKKLYVVTDKFHMRRSMAIADAVYFRRGIELVPSPYLVGDLSREEPLKLVIEDFFRAALWRLTGYLMYDPTVKEQRMPGLDADKRYAISRGYPVNI